MACLTVMVQGCLLIHCTSRSPLLENKQLLPTVFAKTSAVGSVLQEPSYQIDVWLSLNPLTAAFQLPTTLLPPCAVLGASCHLLRIF